MYVAYKTAERFDARNNFNQFGRAQIYLTLMVLINLAAIALVLSKFNENIKQVLNENWQVLTLVAALVLLPFVKMIFTKAVLAKGIKLYKDSQLSSNSRLLGVLYLIVSLAIVIGIIVFK